MKISELQNNRDRTLKKLRAIKKEAYSCLSCREYESICSLIHYMETLKEFDKIKIKGMEKRCIR